MTKRKQRTKHEIEKEIIDFVESLEFPTTSTEIARAIGLNWITSKRYLDKLKSEGKLYLKKVGRQNQWWSGDVYEQKKLAEKSPKLEKRIQGLEKKNLEIGEKNLELTEKVKQTDNTILELKKYIKQLETRISELESR